MIRVFVGYDPREAVVFHVCVQSLVKYSSRPLAITPLALNNLAEIYQEDHVDGTNAFTYSRFLVPFLCGFEGQAIYIDGDMVVRGDISELVGYLSPGKDIAVVKHEYETVACRKYFGTDNRNYPRKNWSSVIVWDCSSAFNSRLTPEFVRTHDGAYLHQFKWLLSNDRIGELPQDWNWLAGEYLNNDSAKLYHYTLGSPCFPEYASCQHADAWWRDFNEMIVPIEATDDI